MKLVGPSGTLGKALMRGMLAIACLAGMAVTARAADPAVPDYSRPEYWSTVDSMPAGAVAAAQAQAQARQVDVFWIHPTTTRSTTDYNHDPLDPAVLQWTEESAVQRQASAFSACCRIFAPRYRAATSKALSDPAMRDKAFALAFADVERAFDWYLTHENGGRPFILAGHSQGGAHVAMLVEKRIQGTPLQARMVAAYALGINLMEGEFGPRFKGIAPCRKPAQTGCIVQWNAMLADSDPAPVLRAYDRAFAERYGSAAAGSPLCINPVTFDAARPLSLSAEARGTVPGEPGFGAMQPLRPGAVAAECRNGLLRVWLAPGLAMEPLPGGSMHYHDVGLFWADIRANAVRRANAWLAVHHR